MRDNPWAPAWFLAGIALVGIGVGLVVSDHAAVLGWLFVALGVGSEVECAWMTAPGGWVRAPFQRRAKAAEDRAAAARLAASLKAAQERRAASCPRNPFGRNTHTWRVGETTRQCVWCGFTEALPTTSP